ncbi:hypothetical protein ISG33_15740 [Glaciecola sp. MH2013]|uniref:hypothetical protein n=1 Tax=Glaciecola sp. MH2013 TaxID=2785524 RepID=UPI00189CB8F5|nr:hypothetical protein [Glaciecola sp. MH2013]MBF7074854.1 hypothetical protein [Glaciecola sp. MH2013]
MMICKQIQECVGEHTNERLALGPDMTTHLQHCEECQQFLATTEELKAGIKALKLLSLSDDFSKKLQQRITAEGMTARRHSSASWLQRRAQGFLTNQSLAACAAAFVIVLTFHVHKQVNDYRMNEQQSAQQRQLVTQYLIERGERHAMDYRMMALLEPELHSINSPCSEADASLFCEQEIQSQELKKAL